MKHPSRQQILAFGLFLGFLVLWFYLLNKKTLLGVNLLIGLAFGSVMRRTLFSFTANLRSPIVDHDFSFTHLFWKMTVTTLIGMNSVILIQSLFFSFDWEKYSHEPTTVSLFFLVGAIIFGMGVTFLGSAGSGLMKKSISGDTPFIVATFFFFIGAILGVLAREYSLPYLTHGKLYMPHIFGWPLALLIQAILLLSMYFIIRKGAHRRG